MIYATVMTVSWLFVAGDTAMPIQTYVFFLILLGSYMIEDMYLPVYWWMRYVRKVSVVRERGIEDFKEYVKTPLGAILMITVDQIVHLQFVWLVAWYAIYTSR